MIYTVTFNPSLDYIVSVEDFSLGRINRIGSERILPGGKGLNVSMVPGNLGIDSTALGFAAGSASAFSELLAFGQEIEGLYGQLRKMHTGSGVV